MKKAILICWGVLTVLSALAESTAMQLLPFIAVMFLMYQDIYQKKDRLTAIVVMSFTMAFLNFAFESNIDVVVWLMTAILYPMKELLKD